MIAKLKKKINISQAFEEKKALYSSPKPMSAL